MLMFGWNFEVGAWSRIWRCLIKICVRTSDLTLGSYLCKQNSTLGSVVPLAMFNIVWGKYHPIMDYGLFPSIHLSLILIHWKLYKRDLHDLYLIPRRQIYDQQFCHRPVTLQCLWVSGPQIIFACQYRSQTYRNFECGFKIAWFLG